MRRSMRLVTRVLPLVGLLAALGACASSADQTWIGKNVTVAVDSEISPPMPH